MQLVELDELDELDGVVGTCRICWFCWTYFNVEVLGKQIDKTNDSILKY